MQHLSSLELMNRAVRSQVCPHCHHRPKGSESMTPAEPRSCEPTCAIFLNLPKLEAIAAKHPNEPGEYEKAIKTWVCADCKLTSSSGEYCGARCLHLPTHYLRKQGDRVGGRPFGRSLNASD